MSKTRSSNDEEITVEDISNLIIAAIEDLEANNSQIFRAYEQQKGQAASWFRVSEDNKIRAERAEKEAGKARVALVDLDRLSTQLNDVKEDKEKNIEPVVTPAPIDNEYLQRAKDIRTTVLEIIKEFRNTKEGFEEKIFNSLNMNLRGASELLQGRKGEIVVAETGIIRLDERLGEFQAAAKRWRQLYVTSRRSKNKFFTALSRTEESLKHMRDCFAEGREYRGNINTGHPQTTLALRSLQSILNHHAVGLQEESGKILDMASSFFENLAQKQGESYRRLQLGVKDLWLDFNRFQ